MEFDLIDHQLVSRRRIRCGRSLPLEARAVAVFHADS